MLGKEEKKPKRYSLIGEQKEQVIELKKSKPTGVRTSFSSFGDNITYKKGFFCYLYAMPTAGKTEFCLGEAVYLAKEHGWNTVVFAPECGSIADTIANLVHKYLGKPVLNIEGYDSATEEEIIEAMKFLSRHFVIIDPDTKVTMEDLFGIIDEINEEYPKWKVDNLIIDCHYDVTLDLSKYGGRQDIAIEEQLAYLRGQTQKRDMYAFLTSHTNSDVKPLVKNGISYYPVPMPNQIRAGASIYRRAFLLCALWRCPVGLDDENGNPYEENTTAIVVSKGKPSRSSTKGFMGIMKWDWKRDRFLDMNDPLVKLPAGSWKKLPDQEDPEPEVNY